MGGITKIGCSAETNYPGPVQGIISIWTGLVFFPFAFFPVFFTIITTTIMIFYSSFSLLLSFPFFFLFISLYIYIYICNYAVFHR